MIKLKKKLTKKVSTLTSFRPMIRSRHPSHDVLRKNLPLLPFRSVVRLGSTTTITDGKQRVECNTVQSVKNSASKLLMKQCFTRVGVKTADWYSYDQYGNQGLKFIEHNYGELGQVGRNISELPYPIICKSLHGSRGEGNSLVKNQQELETFMRGKTLSNYIFEKYYTYSREYRIHVTNEGCFYTCRKMLKNGTPENLKFQRHDDNCVWILETNPSFNKPVNWNEIVDDCVKALNSLGLDIGAFDVKVQSAKDQKGRNRTKCEYIIIESCSAPSFGDITAQKYIEQIPKILKRKYGR